MTAKMHLLLFAVKNPVVVTLLNQAKLLVMMLLPLEKDHLHQIGNHQASAHEKLVGWLETGLPIWQGLGLPLALLSEQVSGLLREQELEQELMPLPEQEPGHQLMMTKMEAREEMEVGLPYP